MPRKLDKKVIQNRIKENRQVMRANKISLGVEMKAAVQGENFNQKDARQHLTTFMRAALAVTVDNAKLETLKEKKECHYNA